MTPAIRPATPADAPLLLQAIHWASEGAIPAMFAEFAPPGMTGDDIAIASVAAPEGELSHANAWIAEAEGTAVGALIGYPLPDPPAPPDPNLPPVIVPLKALEDRVPGHWYVNIVAVLPDDRGEGIGAALMAHAEAEARRTGCPGLALIVAATNTGALRLYQRLGFAEMARAPMDFSAYGAAPTEGLLLVKSC